MKWVVKINEEVLGRVLTNHTMTNEEICLTAGVDLAVTEEGFNGIPQNGKYDLAELEIMEEKDESGNDEKSL